MAESGRKRISGSGDAFTESSGDPLGHDYKTTLARKGTYYRYGAGTIDCSRCDFHLDFPAPVDLVPLGGMAERGKVQFAACSVSSENHPEWGSGAKNLVDGNWTGNYWSAIGLADAWIDWEFGTPIDVTAVEFSVCNHAQAVQFWRRDGDEETMLAEVAVEPNEEENAPDFIRQTAEFRDATGVTALRVRIVDETGVVVWSASSATVRELHPWGTVEGAGKRTTNSTSIMILR